MPKFTSIEAREAFRQAVSERAQWRREVVADLVAEVIPTEQSEGLPWRTVAAKAVRYYKDNERKVRASDSTFDEASDSFIKPSFILNNKSDIHEIFAERRMAICPARSETGQIVGVFASRRKADINEASKFHQKIIEGGAERYNTRAGWLNRVRYIQLPIMALNLLPAQQVEH